jgi:hypothetical protein
MSCRYDGRPGAGARSVTPASASPCRRWRRCRYGHARGRARRGRVTRPDLGVLCMQAMNTSTASPRGEAGAEMLHANTFASRLAVALATPGTPPSLLPFAGARAAAAGRSAGWQVDPELAGWQVDPEFERSVAPEYEKLRSCAQPGPPRKRSCISVHRALTGRRMVHTNAYACGGCV